VVIGSGATAVTLVPALAATAAHVTMLQRTPTYILAMPDEDPIANALNRRLPAKVAYPIVRWKNVLLAVGSYQLSRRRPRVMKGLIRAGLKRRLPAGFDIDRHFSPPYDPWDQRLCLVPNGDLFKSLSRGEASIVTDRIETFTERGLRLESGTELEADVVVTATGLNLLAFGGIELAVDGAAVSLPDTMAYKSMMLSGVPNFAFALGYTNASWTLKADLTSEYVCRVLGHMDAHGHTVCVPERDPAIEEEPFLDFQAGYVLRALDEFPKQGSRTPWRVRQNYAFDVVALRHGPVAGDGLRFSAPAAVAAPAQPLAA
jgi:cation diffusion facilitator CzcD-associated flavoprotein CzcO